MENKRNVSFDLLRVLACFCVIVVHIGSYYKYDFAINSSWLAAVGVDVCARWSVPVFVMIFGAFSKNTSYKNTLKRMARIFVILILASILYMMFSTVLSGSFNFGWIFNSNNFEFKYHLWFLSAYLIVLSISPIINKIVEYDNRIIKYLLIIWCVTSIIPTTVSVMAKICGNGVNLISIILEQGKTFLSTNLIGYYVLGKFLIKNNTSKMKTSILFMLFILITILIYVLTVTYSIKLSTFYEHWEDELNNIFIVLQASSIFCIFKNIEIKSEYYKLVTKLSSCTFGIYLIHIAIIELLTHHGAFTNDMILNITIPSCFVILIRSLIVFIISAILVFIERMIVFKISKSRSN